MWTPADRADVYSLAGVERAKVGCSRGTWKDQLHRLCMALMLRELLHKDQHFILRNSSVREVWDKLQAPRRPVPCI